MAVRGEEAALNLEPFGRFNVPAEEVSLTAYYEATPWSELQGSWTLTAYLIFPDSGKPVEMPSETISMGYLNVPATM